VGPGAEAIVPLLFGKSPYGHPVIGEREHVRGATAKIIKSHYDKCYLPPTPQRACSAPWVYGQSIIPERKPYLDQNPFRKPLSSIACSSVNLGGD